MEQYLKATFYHDYDDNAIQDFLRELGISSIDDRIEVAKRIHDVVRDQWYYNPYKMHFSPESCKASTVFGRSEGHCLDKANLLITFLRAVGIPARLHLAKVKNHIAVELITKAFETDVLTPHGYVEVFIADKWGSATPAFNKSLCDKLGVDVLEFNGRDNAIFQQYDKKGEQFMEYLEDYGSFDDFPLDFVSRNIIQHYPSIAETVKNQGACDLRPE